MSNLNKYDVIIIGAGPAGLTTALYTSRAGLKTLVLDKGLAGGQMNNTADIENYPGFKDILGHKLGSKMMASTSRFGFEHNYGNVKNVQLSKNHEKIVTTNVNKYEAKAIVIATGAKPKKLHVPGEKEYAGQGVSYCAVCDANFFKNQPIVVVGGGDSAFAEAEYLSHIVAHVTIIIRKPHAQAEATEVKQAEKAPNISIIYNHEITKIYGDKVNKKGVQGVRLYDNKTNTKKNFKTNAVFIYIGMQPVTEMLSGLNSNTNPLGAEMRARLQLGNQAHTNELLDSNGWVLSNHQMDTCISGIFAVGDCRKNQIRQIATAVGDGAIASHSICQYCHEN